MTWDDFVIFLSSPLIVSASTSLFVAFAVLLFDKWFLRPRARRKAYELRELEKRLDAHGELVALLKGAKKKAEAYWSRIKTEKRDDLSHYVEQHDIKALDKLFGEKARLMSPKLIDLWIKHMGQDHSRIIDRTRQEQTITEEEGSPKGVYLDLREMEQLAETEYKRLTEKWEKVAEIKLSK